MKNLKKGLLVALIATSLTQSILAEVPYGAYNTNTEYVTLNKDDTPSVLISGTINTDVVLQDDKWQVGYKTPTSKTQHWATFKNIEQWAPYLIRGEFLQIRFPKYSDSNPQLYKLHIRRGNYEASSSLKKNFFNSSLDITLANQKGLETLFGLTNKRVKTSQGTVHEILDDESLIVKTLNNGYIHLIQKETPLVKYNTINQPIRFIGNYINTYNYNNMVIPEIKEVV